MDSSESESEYSSPPLIPLSELNEDADEETFDDSGPPDLIKPGSFSYNQSNHGKTDPYNNI